MKIESTVATPMGVLLVRAEDDEITGIAWLEGKFPKRPPATRGDNGVLALARAWLNDYFAGRFRAVDFPLRAEGSHFQRKVWDAIAAVPPGQTASYGDIAHATKSGPRAVGGACGANPICVVVPCHRVLAAGGRIGGYSGGRGLDTKVLLLRHEGVVIPSPARRARAATQTSMSL
jgi:methylated-DNA-[protein]-cysteine S-methyltransferase